jgi:hypothetical protein
MSKLSSQETLKELQVTILGFVTGFERGIRRQDEELQGVDFAKENLGHVVHQYVVVVVFVMIISAGDCE